MAWIFAKCLQLKGENFYFIAIKLLITVQKFVRNCPTKSTLNPRSKSLLLINPTTNGQISTKKTKKIQLKTKEIQRNYIESKQNSVSVPILMSYLGDVRTAVMHTVLFTSQTLSNASIWKRTSSLLRFLLKKMLCSKCEVNAYCKNKTMKRQKLNPNKVIKKLRWFSHTNAYRQF